MIIDSAELKAARIMLVDDEAEIVELLRRVLERQGFTNLRSTTDPRLAVALYKDFRPDLVLLDLNMPELDGFGVMRQLRQLEPDGYVPILVLSGAADRATRVKALKAGARDFFGKPFDFEVITRIRNMLEIRLMYCRSLDENQRLEAAVRERTRDLEQARLETLRRLAIAAEYRDDDTGTHITRMSRYCGVLAEACGRSEPEVRLVREASPMHDVGKIGIPDAVLLKPGKLDAEEWATMKTHTTIGAQILGGGQSELMQMAERIALTHHERWNGTGYPHGLAGTDIPWEGRIVAVCDVFDALTSERPYKKAWSVEAAAEEIERSAGSHFDPEMAAMFLESLPRILEIRGQQPAKVPA